MNEQATLDRQILICFCFLFFIASQISLLPLLCFFLDEMKIL